jgi:RNA polymerase sigma-70 factor (ECF subfamily)
MNDDDLMRDYYRCNDAVMDEIYRRYQARLRLLFRRGGLSEPEIEDLVQAVFVRVMRTKYPPPGTAPRPFDPNARVLFRTWLFRIARNLLLDFLRTRGRTVDFSTLPAEGDEGDVTAFENTLAGKEPAPSDQVMTDELLVHIRDCMSQLPERERIAMTLWFETSGEMTLADLADTLGVSVPTAYRVQKNALRLMRECLERKGLNP